ncbi:MAG: heme-binding protein [Gammaproteobacteria bacterium]
MSYEEPSYAVVGRAGPVEFRRYVPSLAAETLVEGIDDFDRAGNEGFRRLFRYIAGGNTRQSRIAMTVPVAQAPASKSSEKIAMTVPVQQVHSAGGWRIAFMVPGQYTLDTAPAPSDPRVRVVEVPGRLMAALRYAGRWTERNYQRHRAELLERLEVTGIAAVGEPRLARYDSPLSLPMFRRNEVQVEVERAPG